MRTLGALFLLFVTVAASAADLKVKVIDPQSAAVPGAQVSLLPKGSDTVSKVGISSAEGVATFSGVAFGSYSLQVLAPGFAPQTEEITTHSDTVTVHLRLATISETVVVTATGTPAPA